MGVDISRRGFLIVEEQVCFSTTRLKVRYIEQLVNIYVIWVCRKIVSQGGRIK